MWATTGWLANAVSSCGTDYERACNATAMDVTSKWAIEELSRKKAKLYLGPHANQDAASAIGMCAEVPTSPHDTDILLSFVFDSSQLMHFEERPGRAARS